MKGPVTKADCSSTDQGGGVTVRTPYDSKSKQLGGSSSTLIARMFFDPKSGLSNLSRCRF